MGFAFLFEDKASSKIYVLNATNEGNNIEAVVSIFLMVIRLEHLFSNHGYRTWLYRRNLLYYIFGSKQ